MKAKKFLIGLMIIGFAISLFLPADASAQGKPPTPKQNAKRAGEIAKKAGSALDKKDYRVALEGYSQAVELDPSNVNYRFWKGVSHYYLNEYAQALPELDAANGYKKPLELYTVRWLVNYKLNNLDAALADVKSGLALDPNNSGLLLALGDISLAKNEYRNAIDAYQKTLPTNPNTAADIYYNIARSHASLGDVPAQIAAAEEAIRRGSRFLPEANLLIAEGYRKQKKYDQAIAAYQGVLKTNLSSRVAYESLAEIYRDQNRFTDAIEISRRALRVF